MNRINKILTVLIIIFLMISICSQVLAIDPSFYTPDNPTVDESNLIIGKIGVILGVIRNVSAVVSVIVLMIIGLKYMFGSVQEKANYKASMMPYIIGCVMAVAGTTIVSFIYDSFN